MLEPNADRDAIRDALADLVFPYTNTANGHEVVDGFLDADDLLIVDLRCPTCVMQGHEPAAENDHGSGYVEYLTCPTCHGTGRRDVVVVPVQGSPWEVTARGYAIDVDYWRERAHRAEAVMDGSVEVVPTDRYARLAAVVRVVVNHAPSLLDAHYAAVHALTADDIEAIQP